FSSIFQVFRIPTRSTLFPYTTLFRSVILMILDGWGKSPDPKVSAIDHAHTPFIDSLYTKYPNANLRTDGLYVGLPDGQMGNSERSEEHTSELQSRENLVCRLLLEKKK